MTDAQDLFVIWSGEHCAYWRPKSRGYTTDLRQAGRYTRAQAEYVTDGLGPEKRIEIQPAPAAPVPPCDDNDLASALVAAVARARRSDARYIADVLDKTSIQNIVLQITEGSTILERLVARHVEHALTEQAGRHDARVSELLAANNAEVQRRRDAEAALAELTGGKN